MGYVARATVYFTFPIMSTKYLTLGEFAKVKGEHRQQVQRWVKAGRVFPRPRVGRSPTGRVALLFQEDSAILPRLKQGKKAN